VLNKWLDVLKVDLLYTAMKPSSHHRQYWSGCAFLQFKFEIQSWQMHLQPFRFNVQLDLVVGRKI